MFTVHIGLPKTGTTLLQEVLFARHQGIDYLGRLPKRDLRLGNENQQLFHRVMRSIQECSLGEYDLPSSAARVREQVR